MLFGGKNQISDSLFSELDDNHKKTFREWISALIDRLKTLFKGNKTGEDEITKLEAKFKEMLKESLKSEAPGETNTVSLSYNDEQRITSAMTDDERYEILKNKKISAPIYEGQADKYIEEETDRATRQIGKKAVITIAKKLGIIGTEINFKDIDVKITLSKSNLRESISKKATHAQIAKLLPILEQTAESSILIERHDNRYYYDTDTVYFDNLLGAYVDGEYLVPIRFGLKHSKLGTTTLYVVIDQNKILASNLDKTKNDTGHQDPAPNLIGVSNLRRRVNYSISQIVQFVKSKDLLRYIPDNMLDDSQKTAKWEAIAETIIKTNNKNDKYFTEYIAKNDMRSAQQMVKAAARANGYIYSGYHGTKAKPFTVFKPSVTGVYLATNRQLAEDFATGWRGEKGTVYNLVAKIDKPFIVNEHTKTGVPFYFNIPTPSEMKNSGVTSEIVSTEEIAHWAQDNEYDGVIIDGIREGADVFTTDIIVFEANQIKSADPITYDDNGDIIPLSQRFNEDESDIRFSYTPADEQELTRMAQNGEISAEEYGRRMLEMRESKSADDTYTVTSIAKTAIPPQTTENTTLNPKRRHILTLVLRQAESICDRTQSPDQPIKVPHKTNAKSPDKLDVAIAPRESSIMPQMIISSIFGAPRNEEMDKKTSQTSEKNTINPQTESIFLTDREMASQNFPIIPPLSVMTNPPS